MGRIADFIYQSLSDRLKGLRIKDPPITEEPNCDEKSGDKGKIQSPFKKNTKTNVREGAKLNLNTELPIIQKPKAAIDPKNKTPERNAAEIKAYRL